MTIEVNIGFNVHIKESLLRKIEVIVSEFKSEIGGFLIGKIKDNSIEITDIIFPKQTVGATSVDIDAEDVIPLRKDPRWKDLLGFWHSHLSMGTFWSGQGGDESHIRFLSQDKDISVFIVSSHNNNSTYEHKVRVEISRPFKISFDNVPLNVIRNNINITNILNEIKQYIKQPKYIQLIQQQLVNSKRKYNYDKVTKVLTISNIHYQDYDYINANMPKSINKIKSYFVDSWCMDFTAKDKKEVGNIIRVILDLLKNKEKQQPIYNYNNFRGYWND